MKIIRGIYIWTYYILAAPLFIGIAVPTILYWSIKNKIELGEFGFVDMVAAIVSGVYQGHKINMIFVNHGRDYDFLKDEA